MRVAHAQHCIHFLLIFSLGIMLSACTMESLALAQAPSADPANSDPNHIAPVDSSPGKLDATLGIVDDQDASDKRVQLSIYFQTEVLWNKPNTVAFGGGETIWCNNIQLAYTSTNDHPDLYAANLPIDGAYTCTYNSHGNAESITIPAEPGLNLHMTTSGNSFTATYTPGTAGSCHIRVTPEQGFSGTTSAWVSDTGSYTGTGVNALSGKGDLLLERSCAFRKKDGYYRDSQFNDIVITYDSFASLQVTWRSNG
jgi:hypothetical protein